MNRNRLFNSRAIIVILVIIISSFLLFIEDSSAATSNDEQNNLANRSAPTTQASYSTNFNEFLQSEENSLNNFSIEEGTIFEPYAPEYNLLSAQHMPDNVHVYEGEIDCTGELPPEAELPSIIEYGENNGDNYYTICVTGDNLVIVNLNLVVDSFGRNDATYTEVFIECHYNSNFCAGWPDYPSHKINGQYTVLGSPGVCLQVHQELTTNIKLEPGEYKIRAYTTNAGTEYCPGSYRWYVDVSFAQPNFSQTLAPENACLVGYSDPFVGKPINTKSGDFTHQETDISINSLGFPLTFERSYNGLDFSNGPLGRGWTHSYSMSLELNYNNYLTFDSAVFKAPNGSRLNFSYDPNTESFTPEPGIRASLTHNQDNTYTLSRGDQLAYHFNTNGRLLSISDRQGHVTNLNYSDNQTMITGPDGRSLTLTYSQERLISITDVLNQSITYTYIEHNVPGVFLLHTVTYPDERVITYDYNPKNGFLESISDNQGNLLSNGYDEAGRVITQTLPLDEGFTLAYSNTHTLVNDADEFTTIYTFTNGLFASIENPLTYTTTLTYDNDYNVTSLVGTSNHITELAWDGCNLTQAVQFLEPGISLTTTMDYDDLNNLIQIVDAKSFTTTYTYSGTLLTSSTDALGNTTLYTYTTSADGVPSGLIEDIRDPLHNHTLYDYYTNGDLSSMTDAMGQEMTYTYDELGRLQSTTNVSTGRVDWTCQDPKGRVWRTITNLSPDPPVDPCSNQFVPGSNPEQDKIHDTYYDKRGNAIASIDWFLVDSEVISYTTRSYYDNAGRPTDVVQNIRVPSIYNSPPPDYDPSHPDQNVRTRTIYNDDGTVSQTIDNAGNITQYCYDAMDRVVKTIDNPTVGDPCTTHTPGSNPDEDVINETVYDENGNTIATIDPLGHVTRTYYDALNHPVTVVQNFTGNIQDPYPPSDWNDDNPDQNVRTDTIYDNNGNVLRTIDNDNRITHYCYDKNNRLTKTVANLSNPNADPCDPSFNPSSDPDKDVINSTVYDGNGKAIAAIDPLGIITRTYYDALNRPTLVVRNVDESYIYDDDPPECNQDTGDDYVCTKTIYDDIENAIAVIDPLGKITRTYYDSLNRPIWVIRNLNAQGYENPDPPNPPSFGNDENVAIQTFYDARGRAIATEEYWVEDEQVKSRVTRTYYDNLGRQEWVVRNLDLVGHSIEDPEPPTTWTNTENILVNTQYDAHGDAIINIEFLTDADEQPFTRTNRTYFDRLGRPELIVQNLDPSLDPFSPIHPECNRDRIGDDPPYNICDETVYLRNGEAIAVIEPLGHKTRTYYDGLSRPVTIIENLTGWDISNPSAPPRNPAVPDINVRSDMYYDQAGNRYKTVDPNEVSTGYEYDDLDRLTAVIENYQDGLPLTEDINVRTEYTYDKRGGLLRIRDANAVLDDRQDYTVYEYDDLGRQTTETDPLMQEWTYVYDVQGNRVQMTDANGAVTDYSVDGLDRLSEIDYPDPDATVTYTYNALGWRVAMTDGVGSTSWQYDPLGRIIAVTDPFDSEITYAYDASGNRTRIVYPDQKTVTYIFDSLGRLSQTIDWDTQTTSNKYDVASNTVAVNYPNGVTTSYTYDRMQRLVQEKHTTTLGTLSYFEYAYDPVGNRISQTERVRLPDEPIDSIFADGFESGDFVYWAAHTSSSDLLVGNIASIVDTHGMKVTINDGDTLGVTDDTPDHETHYYARFYFDPNSIRMSSGDAHQIFQGYTEMAGIGLIFKIQLRKSGSLYYIDAYIRSDNLSWALPLSTSFSDTYHAIEIEWKASPTGGTPNGYLKLWVDGTLKGTRSAIDNDAQHLEHIKMGTLSTPNSGTRGWYCFDEFASRREANLGTIGGAHGCGGTQMMVESMLDSSLAIPLTVTLPYTGELPISDTIPLGDIIPITDETAVLTVTMPYTDEIPLSDTMPITIGLAIFPDTIIITDDIQIELNQAVLTVALPVTQSMVSEEGYTVIMTETAQITITGVVSNNLVGSTVEFFPVSPPSSLLTSLRESGWSHVVVINYTYDSLNRLRQAAYSFGRQFDYDYDAVGNVITQTVDLGPGNPVETVYHYDFANRLTYVNSQAYTWDNNGNLLNDGAGTYTYDHANRLASASISGIPYTTFRYNGLGDRLSKNVDMSVQEYTLDLAGGLTQVLSDGTRTYLYGNRRIGEEQPSGWQYYTTDGLGSVRQLIDHTGAVTLAKGYEPYGEVLDSAGSGNTAIGHTGEWTDNTGLVYLRARYYDPTIARFMTKDTWGGDFYQPTSLNAWVYVSSNPINVTDPSGLCARGDQPCLIAAQQLFHDYGWMVEGVWQLSEINILLDSAQKIANFFNEHGGNGQARLRGSISPVWFSHANLTWELLNRHHVYGQTIYMIPGFFDEKVIHESAHILDNLSGGPITASIFGGGASDDMIHYLGVDPSQCFLRFRCPKYLRLLREANAELPPSYGENGPSEDFAETFMLIVQHRLDSNVYPNRWSWMIDYIQNESKTRAAYNGYPYQYLWFLPQPIPVPACSIPQPIATPQP